jgi:isopenicillin N synthase-like dioxygenase
VAQLGFRLLRVLGIGLGLGANYFQPFFTHPMYFLRPLHYSAERSDEAAGLFAAGAHSDYGMLTLLCTDDVPGLQICTDGATWRPVPPLPGHLIVNLGDMLCRCGFRPMQDEVQSAPRCAVCISWIGSAPLHPDAGWPAACIG